MIRRGVLTVGTQVPKTVSEAEEALVGFAGSRG